MEHDGSILFVEDSSGSAKYSAVFEATDGSEEGTPAGGYFYVHDRSNHRVLRHLEIYKSPAHEIKERDIQIFWSVDGTKCGVAVWGQMRGIIDITSNQEFVAPMENPASPAISDAALLKSFAKYMDQDQFIRARQRFWKLKVLEYDADAQPRPENETPIETNFIVFEKGANDLFAVFEDDGDTGYLYVFDAAEHKILSSLQLYDQARALNVTREEVWVVWSTDGTKCGAIIWSKMRGIIDRVKHQEGRVKLEDRDTPGIVDQDWLSGFEA